MLINFSVKTAMLGLCIVFCTTASYAQYRQAFKQDTSFSKRLYTNVYGSGGLDLPFLGVVIVNGKVKEHAFDALNSIPQDSISSVHFLRQPPADSVIKYGPAAKQGILIVSTIKEPCDSP
jgi:hypothetical protein